MYAYIFFVALVATGSQAQSQCSCSCCLGQYCQPTTVGVLNSQNCSADTCLTQCRCSYPQCAAYYPYGQVYATCSSYMDPLFSCDCRCCNANSIKCTPIFVGFSTASVCDISSCSIACYVQYPTQCVSSPKGQTYGSCVGPILTTTTTTAAPPWLGTLCSCSYCPSGSLSCSSSTLLGVASASQCSSSACTQACQSRHQMACSVSYLNQISGLCLSEMNGKVTCKCNCCSGFSCIDYDLTTNDTCASCYSRCSQISPCINPVTIRGNCVVNNAFMQTNTFVGIVLLLAAMVMVL